MKTVAVIVAGGKGERFWPYSRKSRPKQVLSLTSEKPLILETALRLKEFNPLYIVANAFLCEKFKSILPSDVRYIIEPEPRNTGPAMGLACASIMYELGDCVVIFESADHYYGNLKEYLAELRSGAEFASKNEKIVLVGITPKSPHTGYGYIKLGRGTSQSFFEVEQFREKPNIDTARQFVSEGTYVWNSGIAIGKCSVFLREIYKYMPALTKCLQDALSSKMDPQVICHEFVNTEKTSLEFGVYEKSNEIVVLRSSMDWDDVGDYNSLEKLLNVKDNNFYRSPEQPTLMDAKNNIILSEKKVALLGVDDLIIIETEDVILVCKRTDTQKIKDLLSLVEDKYK
jgi:mannose-1-phosphate guanylyltransferase